MNIGRFQTDQQVLVIAEIGNNHEGNFDVARKLIAEAAAAGAHSVKFQTFRTENYVSPANRERFKRLKSFELTYDQFARLKEEADSHNLVFLSTPFDLKSAEFLGTLCPAIKVSSGDVGFLPLLRCVARQRKPVLLSTGAASLRDIAQAKSTLEATWNDVGAPNELALLHCVSAYPTPREQANLGTIKTLGKNFDCTIGYSDHTIGIDAALIAVALGARIIEKHFTLNKNYSDFRDHQLSADPPELKELVRRVRETTQMLGDGEKRLQPDEKPAAEAMKRSIVAARDIPEGAVISWDDLNWVRLQGGLSPGNEEALLGRRALSQIPNGTPLTQRLVA